MEKMNEKMGLLKIQPKPFSSARFQRLATVFQLDSAKKLVFTSSEATCVTACKDW